jgi:hypothetical protein
MTYKTLRGAIIDRFGTLSAFAKEINWSAQRLSLALKNPRNMSTKNLQMILSKLGVTEMNAIGDIILPID